MTLQDADALETAMAQVAEVFGGMTARPDETVCGRCFSEDEADLLRSPNLSLPADLVGRIAQKHPGHWGDQPAVIRRVLPQLVALLAEGADEPELMARGLAAAGWPRWPDEQARPVAGFLEAWWTRTLRTASPPTSADEVFASCATASSTVTPYLALWERERDPAARRHLEICVRAWQEELESGTPPFWWWWGTASQARAAWREVKVWLAGDAARRLRGETSHRGPEISGA